MSENFVSRTQAVRRYSDLRRPQELEAEVIAEAEPLEPQEENPAFSLLSADHGQKTMLEFCLLNGNAFALAYSYLVGIRFNPSTGIEMDFSGYQVHLKGRNLLPLFQALLTQRVSWIQEMDDLQSQATLSESATVVTAIQVESFTN